MALLSLNPSINDQIRERDQQLADLAKKNPQQRFKYPTINPKFSTTDPLQRLEPSGWRGNGFPVTNVTTNLSHDLVQHKYPNRDGARVEEMGRNPLIISCTIPFINTIEPAGQETWKQGTLYPQAFSVFMQDVFNGETGLFQHPFYGFFNCKVQSVQTVLSGTYRGGELVNATFIETITDDEQINIAGVIAHYSEAMGIAESIDEIVLDPAIAKLIAPFNLTFGLGDLLTSISGAINTTSLVIQQGTGLNTLLKKLTDIIDACNNLNDVTVAQLKNEAYVLKGFTLLLKNNSNPNADKIQKARAVFTTIVPTTLSSLANLLNNSLSDLVGLNTKLLKSPSIPANTKVFYFL